MERKPFAIATLLYLTILPCSFVTYAAPSASPPLHHDRSPGQNVYIIEPGEMDIPVPEKFSDNAPHPLMQGEGFNYNLYYNYHLTPHLILRPNVQRTTKPGSVSDDHQRFVGGIGAGINF